MSNDGRQSGWPGYQRRLGTRRSQFLRPHAVELIVREGKFSRLLPRLLPSTVRSLLRADVSVGVRSAVRNQEYTAVKQLLNC